MMEKSLQVIKNKNDNVSYTPIKVNSLKSAKRLLSKLIYELQTGNIDNQKAKDLTYLLISFVNVFKQYEIERRLEEVEKRWGI